MSHSHWIAVSLVVSIAAPAAAAPEDDVSALVSASHGLQPESGAEVMQLLDKVRADCATYLPALQKRLDPTWIGADRSGERERQSENAVAVLSRCDAAGRNVLVTRFSQLSLSRTRQADELAKRGAELKRPQHPELVSRAQALSHVDGVRNAIVRALADAKDASLRDALLASFESENYVLQLRALDYFQRATPRDAAVKAKLAPLLTQRESVFYQSPKLRAVVE